MLAKEPSGPFIVDRLAGPLFKLRKNPPVAVLRMLIDDLANAAHQLLIFLGEAARTLLSVVVGTLWQVDRPKTPVEPAVFLMLIHEADFFARGQLSPKKFFSRAISTSF